MRFKFKNELDYKMKILLVSPTLFEYPVRMGGAETYVDALAAALSEKPGVTVSVLGFSPKLKGKFQNKKVTYYIYKSHPLKNNPSNPLPLFNFFTLLRYDVIYLQQYHTWLTFFCLCIGKLAGKKILLTDHNGGGATYNRRFKIDRFIDIFFTTSKLSSDEIKLSPKALIPIYGGVDTQKFTSADEARQGLLFVGRAHPIKGIIPFLEQVSNSGFNEKITLVLAVNYDNQDYFNAIERFIKENKLENCKIKKNITGAEIIREYQTHRWCVLPSVDEIPHESLGLTVYESLACDTPVAFTPWCGISEIFRQDPQPFAVEVTDFGQFFKDYFPTTPQGARNWILKNGQWTNVADKILSALKP